MVEKLDFSGVNILVAGDIILDNYIAGDVNRISPEAPVPIIKHTDSSFTLGGAANVANNLVKLGCNVTILGLIGKDQQGEKVVELLSEANIKSSLIRLPLFPTITKTRIISNGHQICRIDYENPYQENHKLLNYLKKKEIDFNEFDILILSDYNKGFIDNDVSKFLIDIFTVNDKQVIVDPKKKDWKLYYSASMITPNFAEFCELVDNPKDELDVIVNEARKIIKKFELESLLITRSEKGMVWINSQSIINVETKAKEVFDVSGAGDTVIATFAASCAKGFDINKSLELSNIAAGIVVGKAGTVPVNIEELQSAFNNIDTNFIDFSSLINKKKDGTIIILSNLEENCINLVKSLKYNQVYEYNELIIAIHSDEYFEKKFNRKPKLCVSDKLQFYNHLDFIDGITIIHNKEQEKYVNLRM